MLKLLHKLIHLLQSEYFHTKDIRIILILPAR